MTNLLLFNIWSPLYGVTKIERPQDFTTKHLPMSLRDRLGKVQIDGFKDSKGPKTLLLSRRREGDRFRKGTFNLVLERLCTQTFYIKDQKVDEIHVLVRIFPSLYRLIVVCHVQFKRIQYNYR